MMRVKYSCWKKWCNVYSTICLLIIINIIYLFQWFRHCLEKCPQLGIMEELQILNLQHNSITRIQHLSNLQQLVFLNLYDNHISEMSGIETLSSLRILMLGKNRLVVSRCTNTGICNIFWIACNFWLIIPCRLCWW